MEDKTMSLIKWTKDESPVFPSLLENFFGGDFPGFMRPAFMQGQPAVNILENKDNFEIEVAVPGMDKNDFKLNVNQNLLSISCEKEQKNEESNDRYTRREFGYASFERSFSLPESVNAEKIEAKYKDGILKINVPKKEEAKEKPAREIKIS
jgi:HSP20 family protein